MIRPLDEMSPLEAYEAVKQQDTAWLDDWVLPHPKYGYWWCWALGHWCTIPICRPRPEWML